MNTKSFLLFVFAATTLINASEQNIDKSAEAPKAAVATKGWTEWGKEKFVGKMEPLAQGLTCVTSAAIFCLTYLVLSKTPYLKDFVSMADIMTSKSDLANVRHGANVTNGISSCVAFGVQHFAFKNNNKIAQLVGVAAGWKSVGPIATKIKGMMSDMASKGPGDGAAGVKGVKKKQK